MSNKEKKEKNAILFGIILGVDIIAISWVLLLIPALLVQALGIEHNSNTYMIIMCVFQIIAGFLATFISLKISLKSSYILGNDITKAMTTGMISVSILTIINYFIGNLLPIIPFNSIIGLFILIADYTLSHFALKKLYLN